MNTVVSSPKYIEIQLKMADLQSALLEKNPQMPLFLRDIHSQLKQNPEVVTLLTEDEIALVIAGLSQQTMTHLAGSTLKSAKSASGKAALKKVSTDDLGF